MTHGPPRAVDRAGRPDRVWTISWRSPAWQMLAPTVGRTALPERRLPAAHNRVPVGLWHLFWDTDAGALRVDRHGPYIVDRVLRMNDLQALGWVARTVAPDGFRRAAGRRGLSPAQRRLATLIADSACL